MNFSLTKHQAAEHYKQMILIRRFEEATERLYQRGQIRGFLHTYIGQEAIAVGAVSQLQEDDYVIGHYRDHGHALARGLSPREVMAELCGKGTGTSGGKGGSMHLFDAKRHFMGGYAIVAGQMPIATGLALALKYRGDNNVVLCFFGDGAVSEGEFHESLNLASLWKLPILFFLENNLYGMGSRVDRTRAGGEDIYRVAEPYDIPAAQIDGMDIIAVRETTMEAIQRIREGSGPIFIEGLAYRFHGHSMADPAKYRDAAEVGDWINKDPITRFKSVCTEKDLISQEDLDRLDQEVATIVEDAILFADQSPEPALASMYQNVYA